MKDAKKSYITAESGRETLTGEDYPRTYWSVKHGERGLVSVWLQTLNLNNGSSLGIQDLVSDKLVNKDLHWRVEVLNDKRFYLADPALDTLPDDIQSRWRAIRMNLVQAPGKPIINPYRLI